MENKNTPLSEKKAGTHLHDYYLDDGEHGCNPNLMTYFYHEDDVKEAVQKLKEKADLDEWQIDVLKEIFGSLAE